MAIVWNVAPRSPVGNGRLCRETFIITLMIGAVSSSETSVIIYRTRRRENLDCYTVYFTFPLFLFFVSFFLLSAY
jgi:hypothetical protein